MTYRSSLLNAPWQIWVAAIAGAYCLYLLVINAAFVFNVLTADVRNESIPIIEFVLKTIGLAALVGGTALALYGKAAAVSVTMVGALVYVMPWLYRWLWSAFSQPSLEHSWWMLIAYPRHTYESLIIPVSIVAVVKLAMNKKSTK